MANEQAATPRDRHVDAVINKHVARAQGGFRKYGVTTERTDFTTLDWLNHAQQEAMDFSIYLERMIQDEEKRLREMPKA